MIRSVRSQFSVLICLCFLVCSVLSGCRDTSASLLESRVPSSEMSLAELVDTICAQTARAYDNHFCIEIARMFPQAPEATETTTLLIEQGDVYTRTERTHGVMPFLGVFHYVPETRMLITVGSSIAENGPVVTTVFDRKERKLNPKIQGSLDLRDALIYNQAYYLLQDFDSYFSWSYEAEGDGCVLRFSVNDPEGLQQALNKSSYGKFGTNWTGFGEEIRCTPDGQLLEANWTTDDSSWHVSATPMQNSQGYQNLITELFASDPQPGMVLNREWETIH